MSRVYSFLLPMLLPFLVGVAIAILLTGCIAVGGPSQWRPDLHASMMETCRAACHKSGMSKYDSMDGSCECRGPSRGH